MTNPHKVGPQYCNSETLRLAFATSHTPELIGAGLRCLERIYKPGYRYKKAGVMLAEIEDEARSQLPLPGLGPEDGGRRSALMAALDRVNGKWGRATLQYAAAGLGKPWAMRQLRKSPRRTTSWEELVAAG